jgi:hypothetical protein
MYPAVIFPDDEVVRAWPASLRRTRSELDPPSPQWGTVRPNMPALDPAAPFPVYDDDAVHLQESEVAPYHLRHRFPDISSVVLLAGT